MSTPKHMFSLIAPHLFLDYSSLFVSLYEKECELDLRKGLQEARLKRSFRSTCVITPREVQGIARLWLHNSIKRGVADIKLLVCVDRTVNRGHKERWLDFAFVKSLPRDNFFWRSIWLPDNTDAVTSISSCVYHPSMDTSMPHPSILLIYYPPIHAYRHTYAYITPYHLPIIHLSIPPFTNSFIHQ